MGYREYRYAVKIRAYGDPAARQVSIIASGLDLEVDSLVDAAATGEPDTMSNASRILDPDAYRERVEYAARCIREGRTGSRNFSNCFEMYDGDHVVAALIRKADKSPSLAELLPKAIDAAALLKLRKQFEHCTSKQIEELAAQTRDREQARMKAIIKLCSKGNTREKASVIANRYIRLVYPKM